MYAISGVCLFKALLTPMCRSLIASVIARSEIGKIFSITTAFEAASIMIASPVYTFVYTKTFHVFPGAFNIISTISAIVNLSLALYLMNIFRYLNYQSFA